MTKAKFYAEFERRTGRRLRRIEWDGMGADTSRVICYRLQGGSDGQFIHRRTSTLYSKVHLDAVCKAAGEVEK